MAKDDLSQRLRDELEATAARLREQIAVSKKLTELSKRHLEQTQKMLRAIDAKKTSK
jgi:hypothetical protein